MKEAIIVHRSRLSSTLLSLRLAILPGTLIMLVVEDGSTESMVLVIESTPLDSENALRTLQSADEKPPGIIERKV